jgi:hypothetical protein
MAVEMAAAELSALLGLAAAGAADEAGRRALGRVLDVFRRNKPAHALELEGVLAQLTSMSTLVVDIAGANADLATALTSLRSEVNHAPGVNIQIAGNVGKQATVYGDVERFNM